MTEVLRTLAARHRTSVPSRAAPASSKAGASSAGSPKTSISSSPANPELPPTPRPDRRRRRVRLWQRCQCRPACRRSRPCRRNSLSGASRTRPDLLGFGARSFSTPAFVAALGLMSRWGSSHSSPRGFRSMPPKTTRTSGRSSSRHCIRLGRPLLPRRSRPPSGARSIGRPGRLPRADRRLRGDLRQVVPRPADVRPQGGFHRSPAFVDDGVADRIGSAFQRTIDELCFPDVPRPDFDDVRERLSVIDWL